jgi:hypothetical protein
MFRYVDTLHIHFFYRVHNAGRIIKVIKNCSLFYALGRHSKANRDSRVFLLENALTTKILFFVTYAHLITLFSFCCFSNKNNVTKFTCEPRYLYFFTLLPDFSSFLLSHIVIQIHVNDVALLIVAVASAFVVTK